MFNYKRITKLIQSFVLKQSVICNLKKLSSQLKKTIKHTKKT